MARLLDDAGVPVVALACTVRELIDGVGPARPDVVVVDPALPAGGADEDALAAVARMRRADPELAVLVLGGPVAAGAAATLGSGRGGVGHLDRHDVGAADELARAVECVAMGGTLPVAAVAMAAPAVEVVAGPGPLDGLSRRELEVLALIAEGASNAAIAEILGIAGKTVDSHVGRILVKLGVGEDPAVNRRVKAALLYLAAGPGPASAR